MLPQIFYLHTFWYIQLSGYDFPNLLPSHFFVGSTLHCMGMHSKRNSELLPPPPTLASSNHSHIYITRMFQNPQDTHIKHITHMHLFPNQSFLYRFKHNQESFGGYNASAVIKISKFQLFFNLILFRSKYVMFKLILYRFKYIV